MEMEEMDLREYWDIIVKKRLLIAIVFLVTVVAVTIYSLVATPIYEAQSTLIVKEASSGSVIPSLDAMGGMGKNTSQNYIQIMKSRTILEQVVDEVGNEEISPGYLAKEFVIQPVQGSDVLKISLQSADPEEAQNYVNTLVSVFLEWNRLYQQNDRRTARIFIESQLESVSESLRLAEEELRVYKEQEKVLAPSQETLSTIEQMAKLEANLSEVIVRADEVEERMVQVRSNLSSQEQTLVSSTTITQNSFVTQYRARLADLEISLSGAKEKYTNLHPSVLSLEAEIEDVKQKLAEEIERVIGTETRSLNAIHQELYGTLIALEVESMALKAREQALNNVVAQHEATIALLPAKELEFARLMRDAKVLEELYILLRTRNEETKISEAMQTADIQVIDSAILPLRPVKPRVKLNIAIGAVLGMFLGVGLAFLVEFMDNTINTKEEAERLLEIPVLGQIPDFELVTTKQKKRFLGK